MLDGINKYELIKYLVSQLALFVSYITFVSIIFRKNIFSNLKTIKIKRFILIFSSVIVCLILYIDHNTYFLNDLTYCSMTLIIIVFVVNLIYIDVKNTIFLFFNIVFFNYILHNFNYSCLYESYKFLAITIICILFYFLPLKNFFKGIFVLILSHLYCVFEILVFNFDNTNIFGFLKLSILYTLVTGLIHIYLFKLYKKFYNYYRMSHCDYLTGLYNERYLSEQYQTIIKNVKNLNEEYCFILIDVNNLKNINDKYGHRYGDEAIKMTAYVISQIWSKDLIVRKSGDEFIVLYKGNKAATKKLANEFIEYLNERYITCNEKNIYLTAAVGICVINKKNCDDNIFEIADRAMYEDKQEGKEFSC